MKTRMMTMQRAQRAHYRLIALHGLGASSLINFGDGTAQLRTPVARCKTCNCVNATETWCNNCYYTNYNPL